MMDGTLRAHSLLPDSLLNSSFMRLPRNRRAHSQDENGGSSRFSARCRLAIKKCCQHLSDEPLAGPFQPLLLPTLVFMILCMKVWCQSASHTWILEKERRNVFYDHHTLDLFGMLWTHPSLEVSLLLLVHYRLSLVSRTKNMHTATSVGAHIWRSKMYLGWSFEVEDVRMSESFLSWTKK